jgi:hypothetical protein
MMLPPREVLRRVARLHAMMGSTNGKNAETRNAVAGLLGAGRTEVMQADIQKALKLDKSVVSRRVAAAMDAGVLRNLEDRKGRPARLVLGDTLPEEIELLPKPERLHGCTVAEGGEHPLLHGNARDGLHG